MDTYIGKPMDRVDGRLKVTGRALYSADHPVPNLVHGVLVTSTIAKGRVAKMDAKAAEKAPGVLAVFTPFNAPKLPPQKEQPNQRKVQVLQDNAVYYSNQPIAVVVAETLEQATYAARLLRITYQAEAHNVVVEHALGDAYKPKEAGSSKEPTDSLRGDLVTGRSQAAQRIEQTYTTPAETHNPMEPHGTIAFWEGSKLTLFDATQGVFTDRERVASLLGIQPDDVHVVSLFLGGGFGSKGPSWSHVILAAMASRKVNRPVKLVLFREQMFGPVGFRGRTRQTLEAAAQSDATLVALRHDTVAQTSSFDEFVETASLTARMLYQCPNVSTSHRLVRVDTGTPSYMRAPGEAPGTYALEAALDELSYALKVDPVELRLRNYAAQDPNKNKPWSSKSLNECYRQGAERFGWSKRSAEVRSMREGRSLVGWGMATAVYPTRRSPSAAKATLRPDGSFLVEAGTQDLGTGTYTIMTQIAADNLGVRPRQIVFKLGDTDYPKTPVSGGSQTAASTGSAVKAAAEALREKLVQMAVSHPGSPLSGVSAQDIVIEDGSIQSKSDPSRKESLAEIARRAGTSIEAQADFKPDSQGDEKPPYSMYAFGAQFAEVHVDESLGQLRVTRMVGAFGAGRILNAKTARSQLLGGMIWGVGMALLEDTMFDPRHGRIVNANLAEYHVPVNLDAPSIEVITVPEEDTHINQIGAKGVGEIGITGATAAIVNAVYHATGKRVRELPVTLDKLI
jgi:xanthine dehydrogenase YagR molybdenum-binding subunit